MQQSTADARFWDGIARKYARDPIKDLAGYERTLDRVGELVGPAASVLEIGCGTGTTALRLAPKVHRLLATDISSEMIAIAREKAAAQDCRNVVFEVAGAADLCAAPGSFDAVLALNLFHLVRDRSAVLHAACRLLKPGGLLISKTPCLSEMNLLVRLAVPIAQRIGKAPHVSFFSAPEIEAEIAAAGFDVCERSRHGSSRRDPRIFIAAKKRGRDGVDEPGHERRGRAAT